MLCKCGCDKEANEGKMFITGHNRRGHKNPHTLETKKGIAKKVRKVMNSPEMQAKIRKPKRDTSKMVQGKKNFDKWQKFQKGRTYDQIYGKEKSVAHRKILSEAQTGIKNHGWQGGISFEPYSVDWTETLKRSIRERDKYTCQICGKEPSVHVHHIDYNKKNCCPDNLITLCSSCHVKTNYKRKYWQDYFNTRHK